MAISLRDKLEGVKAALHRAHQHVNMDHGGRTEAWEHIESAIPKMARAYKLMPEILSDAIMLQAQAESASSMMMDVQQQYIALKQDYNHLRIVFQEFLDLYDMGFSVDAAIQSVYNFWRDYPEERDPEPDHDIHYGDGRDFDEPYPPEDDPSYLT